MEISEAIEKLKEMKENCRYKTYVPNGQRDEWKQESQAIDTVLEELNNRISKDDLKNILRRVQDYQLNYKDTVLFNIIMQEIFGETEWTNLENKE